MKIAMLIPDNRDEFGHYDEPVPVFGPAPTALLEGMSSGAELTGARYFLLEKTLALLRKNSQTTYSFICCHVKTLGEASLRLFRAAFWRFEKNYKR